VNRDHSFRHVRFTKLLDGAQAPIISLLCGPIMRVPDVCVLVSPHRLTVLRVRTSSGHALKQYRPVFSVIRSLLGKDAIRECCPPDRIIRGLFRPAMLDRLARFVGKA